MGTKPIIQSEKTTYFYNDVIISGVDFWEFEKVNSFPLFIFFYFFQLDFCAVLHLVTLGFLFSSYKQVLLATAEKGAEPECLLPFSLLTPLKASNFPQGACIKLSLGSLQ